MFTYINPSVRARLEQEGKLQKINHRGELLGVDDPVRPGEVVINLLGPIPLPLKMAGKNYTAKWYATVRSTELEKVEELAATLRESGGQNLFATLATSMAVNSVLLIGDPLNQENPLVRVHSNCLTGDVFGSERCECGPQLATAMERINQDPCGGMIIYMAGHEGRGIGLWAKAATYLLQDAGENTYQANESLGLPADSRDFSDAAALILHFLGNRPIRLLTNNPKKIEDLAASGLDQLSVEKHVAGVSNWNQDYLSAKRNWGHKIDSDDITQA
ncbi:MAG: GTP cyclohydrolase II [Parasphingorhabdus sp.]|jgi:GTP cyclohydrolase II